ncbi:hypothetical protein GCM10011513_37920 [Franconibacter daqui]|nr:hypothetical protein GCM10011513_37920 [Franconibacter daqui]
MSFGSYDLVSLAKAREKRDTARKQVANGIDPVEERKAQKLAQQLSTENSFEAICREWHTNKADRGTVAYREEIIKAFEQMCSRSLVNGLLVKSNLWNCLKYYDE